MRVVHIDRQRSWTGQISRGFHEGVGLRARGHEVAFIAHPGSKLGERARAEGFEVLETPMRGARAWPSLRRIRRFLTAGVDVLHAHGPRDHLLALLAAPAGRVRALVRTKHNHTRLRSGFFSRLLFQRTAAVVAVSGYVRDQLLADGIPARKVSLIHDAIDLERFAPRPRDEALRAQLGLGPDDLVVGNVSSLHERKGIEELLRGFAELRRRHPDLPLRCLLVGKTWERWVPLAEELGVKELVSFPGFQTDVPAWLSQLDVYVLPSREEALGTSIVEAMGMGLPVVVSAVGGIPEVVTEGCGICLPSATPEALADAMSELVQDEAQRRALGLAARARVEGHFSSTAFLDRTEALYQRLLA